MSEFYTDQRQFTTTPKDKYQDQLILIWSIQKKNSTMNNTNIKTNNPKESTSKIIKDKNILKNQPS